MKFNYQARDKKGQSQRGTIEASSREAALSLLQKHKLFITFLEEAKKKPFYERQIKLFQRISQKDVVNFSRQLSLMFKSKIPLVSALQSIGEQTRNSGLREKILSISQDVEGGTPFSQALSSHPKLFSPFYVSMVKSGEASGTLSESLTYLADHLEKEYYLSSKIKGAMIYPALIVVVVIGVLVMMVYFVIPNMTKVLVETGQELPFLTKVVIGSSNFFRSWGWILFLVIAGLIAGLMRYLKTIEGKRVKDKFLLKTPLIGSFLRMIYLSRFAENLSTLITGGLPIVQALDITGDIVGNVIYQDIISQIKDEVRRGEKISKVLARFPDKFPPILVQMVTVGEKTGTLGQSLTNVVDFYQKEIDRGINNLLSIIEPLLVIFLGGLVAGLMGAILMPLYKMTGF
ncbi:Type II secretion system protein F [subsurface metagenome]